MPNAVYKKAKQNILNGKIDFSTKNFRVLFTDSSYVVNLNLDEFVSDISLSSIKLRSTDLESVTNVDGTVDAQDIVVTIPANTSFDYMVFYQVGLSDNESRLLFYIDSADGLPFSGLLEEINMVINWNNSSTKILSL